MMNTIERKISTVNDELTVRLDDLESTLPPIPAKALSFSRATARRVNDVVSSSLRTIGERTSTAADGVATSARTVSGQASSQVKRSADVVSGAVKTVRGQAASEARQAAGSVADQVEGGLDDATVAVDPSDLTSMSKAELYDRAQDLDIEGRSSMSKAELISAIESA